MGKTNESRLDSFFQTMLDELTDRQQVLDSPAIQRQINRARKRAMYIRPELDVKCLEDFKVVNTSLLHTKIQLSDQIVNDARHFITVMLERFNSNLSDLNIQETLDMSYLLSLWRFGPGASNGVSGTHAAEKIQQKMTCTASCEPLVVKLRSTTPYFLSFDAMNNGGTTLYEGSRLTTVPKNEDAVRIIAIEPSGNMALQLAAGQYLTDVLRSIGLDISKQQLLNKSLAKRGSVDGSLATIDLKAASDMFTPELIRLLVPPKWYELLMKIRSPSTMINGEQVTLNMISTMGNGFTFPLMTLCLVSLIYGFRAGRGGPTLYVSWTDTAVFGDDIIIPSHEYAGFADVLQQAGLLVNHDKSYYVGPFRESCGGDYYLGEDITPFYCRSLDADSDVFIVINQVLSWGSKVRCFLPKTLAFLGSLLRRPFFVPEWSNPDQGILIASVPRRYSFLQPVQVTKKLLNEHFALPLVCGGYVESDGSNLCYLPRQYNTRYRVRKGRLPKGYLSGYDPIKRTASDSATIDLWASLVFGSLSGPCTP